MTRGDVDNGGSENIRNIKYFNSYDQKSDGNDEELKNIILNPPTNYQKEKIELLFFTKG